MTAFICSPYRGDTSKHIAYAKELTKYAIDNGYAPITPHLYLTLILDDNIEIERNQGINCGLKLLEFCDFILVGKRYGVSQGMEFEIKKAKELNKNIIYLD